MANTMRAILVKDGKGPIENLYIGEAERPKPTIKGQVVVEASRISFIKNLSSVY